MNCSVCLELIPAHRLKRFPHTVTCSALCTTNRYKLRAIHPSRHIAKDCETCGKSISVGRLIRSPHTKTCSHECSQQRGHVLYLQQNRRSDVRLTPGTVGAIGELRVAIDLLQKGHAVFRALSSSCPCDLAVLHNNKLITVEVKTASITRSGKLTCPNSKKQVHDVLAAVLPDQIVYIPDLSTVLPKGSQPSTNSAPS